MEVEGLDPRLRVVTFKVEPHFLLKVDIVAAREGMARSELIRRALEEYIKSRLPEEADHRVQAGTISQPGLRHAARARAEPRPGPLIR